jgi:chromosomal replication initiator protein
VPHAILEEVARRVQSNIRELEGALTRVLAYAELRGEPLSTELVESALADMLVQTGRPDGNLVIEAVAKRYGLETERLLSRDRTREVARPRQIAMYLMRQETDASLPKIGDMLGGRDHTTVLYGSEKISELIETDDSLRREVMSIREQLYRRLGAAP